MVRKRSYLVQQVDELSIELPRDDITFDSLWKKARENQSGDFDVKSLPNLD